MYNEKVDFVEGVICPLLMKLDDQVRSVYFDKPIGASEYVVIEYTNGEELRVNVTGDSKRAILIDVAWEPQLNQTVLQRYSKNITASLTIYTKEIIHSGSSEEMQHPLKYVTGTVPRYEPSFSWYAIYTRRALVAL